MKNAKFTIMFLAPTLLIALSSCSSEAKNESVLQEPSTNVITVTNQSRGAIILNTTTATATVKSVDAQTRTVVLQREDGSEMTYVCEPEVRNFDRIEVGDKVNVTLAEELAVALLKGDVLPATGRTTVLVRSEPGAKPGGKLVDTVAVNAQVVAVDTATRTVTLQLPDGHNKKVAVGPDVHLENVNAGDHVGVRLTQALIITVEKP